MKAVKDFNLLDGKLVTEKELTSLKGACVKDQRTDLVERINKVLGTMDKEGVSKVRLSVDEPAEHVDMELKNRVLALESLIDDNYPTLSVSLNGAVLADGHELFTEEEAAIFNDSEPLLGLNASAKDVEVIVNELILKRIQNGEDLPPWRKTWANNSPIPAQNFDSKKPYSGSNATILNVLLGSVMPTPYYLTANQIKKRGGAIKKGSKGVPVVYYNFYHIINDLSSNPAAESSLLSRIAGKRVGRGVKAITLSKSNYAGTNLTQGQFDYLDLKENEYWSRGSLRYYYVFNLGDTTGIEYELPKPKVRSDAQRIDTAEEIIKSFTDAPKIIHDPKQASYELGKDIIKMPKIESFDSNEEYYSTLFHEMIHSTMHKTRLDRIAKYKDKEKDAMRAFEELIAELGASYLCGLSGFLEFTSTNAAAYLKGWHEKLQKHTEDYSDFFVFATKEAQAAVEYIIRNYKPSEKEQAEETKYNDKDKARARAKALILKLKLKNRK